MTFSEALVNLKEGGKVKRVSWVGEFLHIVELDNIRSGPVILLFHAPTQVDSPWFAPHNDLLADDWVVLA